MEAPLGFFDYNASGLIRNRLDGAVAETKVQTALSRLLTDKNSIFKRMIQLQAEGAGWSV